MQTCQMPPTRPPLLFPVTVCVGGREEGWRDGGGRGVAADV